MRTRFARPRGRASRVPAGSTGGGSTDPPRSDPSTRCPRTSTRGPSRHVPRIDNFAIDRRDGGRRGAREVHGRVRVPHAPRIVSVRRAEDDLAVARDSAVDAGARAAPWRVDHRPRVEEDIEQSRPETLVPDVPRGGRHEQTGPLRNLIALQDSAEHSDVLEAGVRARAEVHLVDPETEDAR